MSPASKPHEADMLDVVQKFEQLYGQIPREKNDRIVEPAPAELATAAFEASCSLPAHDKGQQDRNHPAESSWTIDPASAALSAAAPTEKYELPEGDPVPSIERTAPSAPWRNHDRKPRRVWPMAFGGVVAALLIGVAVGYVIVPRADVKPVRAKIEASPHGGTQLRVDYELRKR